MKLTKVDKLTDTTVFAYTSRCRHDCKCLGDAVRIVSQQLSGTYLKVFSVEIIFLLYQSACCVGYDTNLVVCSDPPSFSLAACCGRSVFVGKVGRIKSFGLGEGQIKRWR